MGDGSGLCIGRADRSIDLGLLGGLRSGRLRGAQRGESEESGMAGVRRVVMVAMAVAVEVRMDVC